MTTPLIEGKFVQGDGCYHARCKDIVFLSFSLEKDKNALGVILNKKFDLQLGLKTKQFDFLKKSSNWNLKCVAPKECHKDIIEIMNDHGVKIEKMIARDGEWELYYTPKKNHILASLVLENSSLKKEKQQINILIIDDSKTIRDLLIKVLSDQADFKIMATAARPSEALEIISKNRPDVITLDMGLPEMDGVALMEKYMSQFGKIPTVVISALAAAEGSAVVEALSKGAFDYVQKPSFSDWEKVGKEIIEKVRLAAQCDLKSTDVVVLKQNKKFRPLNINSKEVPLIAIGSSTGGVKALTDLLVNLPNQIPPIVIAQHIPAVFSKNLAERINGMVSFTVAEAVDGEELRPGKVYLAPGGKHMEIVKSKSGSYHLRIISGDALNVVFRPNIDFLFKSVAANFGPGTIGVILTGMGEDGAKGLLAMKEKGHITLGQSEETCVVYGMPRVAQQIGATSQMLSPEEIGLAISESLSVLRKNSA